MTANERSAISFLSQRRADKLKSFWLRCRQLRNQLTLARKWYLGSHTPYQPVFVLATHRSGSNLLIDYMKRLPGIRCLSEILCITLPYGIARRQSRSDFALRHVRRSLHSLGSPIRGCKLMLDQLATCQLPLSTLDAAFPDAKYIILYRQSLTEQYLSHQSAKATQQWYLVDEQKRKQARVTVDPIKLRSYCADIRGAYREILDHAWLPRRSALLSYEELAADPAWCFSNHIGPLLNVPVNNLETALKKQNTLPLAERVANYREVAALLASPLCTQHYSWSPAQSARRAA